MPSINELENLEELTIMFDHFWGYYYSDLDYLLQRAVRVTNDEFDKAHASSSIQIPHITTIRLGDKISETEIPSNSRCTAPLCMLLFAGIDLIGQLSIPFAESTSNPFSITKGFARNAQVFLYHLANDESLKKDETANLLMEQYRHSIAHSYLPGAGDNKQTYSIAYQHDSVSCSLFTEIGKEKILDVNYLSKLVIKGMTEFKEQIALDKFTDAIIKIYNTKILRFNSH